jgi:hypothetical protein
MITLKIAENRHTQKLQATRNLSNVALLANLAFADVFDRLEPIHTLPPLEDIEAMRAHSAQR